MIPHDPFRQLHDFDRTSPQFHEQLTTFFCGDAYRSVFPDHGDEKLAWFVEYLDSVIASISDHATPVFQISLRELGRICGAKEVLPKSCTLSDSLLGCVYEGTFNGSRVRIRRVKIRPGADPRKAKQTFRQVAAISKHLSHPNIVPLLGVTIDPLEFISDWMPGGDLMGYIANHADADRSFLLSDVAEGLHYLHSREVIHGDLKCSNVLVDTTGHARITDFGLAAVTRDSDLMWGASTEHGQNARWIAPEILDNRGTYSKEADIFSFAGVAIEAFTGATPFGDKPPHAARLAVASGVRPPRPAHPALTDKIWTLLQRCWNQEPQLRPRPWRISSGFGVPAWKRAVELPLASDEQISLITHIFSDRDEIEVVEHLYGDDAQTFVDVMNKTLDSLGTQLRQKCLSVLCEMCGRQHVLPRSLQIPLCDERSDGPLYGGGSADVFEGKHQGTKVAVKVLTVVEVDLDKIRSGFCKEVIMWRSLRHPNVLSLLGVTMTSERFEMVSEWMDNGNVNEFIKVHKNKNRFELLEDVARGLIYLHDQAMIHGDLKGANILIDRNRSARLADFGLLTLVSNPTDPAASISITNPAGTTRWMSPELHLPRWFGFKDSRRTKESDCYALGMVILEVLSGQAPFANDNRTDVIRKVINGERPERPKEVWFTDDLWGTLEQCWSSQPKMRPTAEAVLERLGQVSLAVIMDSRKRLITRSFSQGELPFLLEAVFWNGGATYIVQSLEGSNSQDFIDILDEALLDDLSLPQGIRKECLQSLYETCACRAIFPTSLRIQLDNIQPNGVPYWGESANVAKHIHRGREIAVKTLRIPTSTALQAITRRFCKEFVLWNTLRHPNILSLTGVIMTKTQLAMVSGWMPNGSINQFVKERQDVNRFKLLSDVAKGLIYMHDQGMIHGGLRGGNILIDKTCHARIADFGFTILSDSMIPNLGAQGGTVRWMSPELLDSGAQDRQPTKYSDCYALGMVIYEVISLCVPFYQYQNSVIPGKVVQGDRPERPKGVDGVRFTNDVWEMLERCWAHKLGNRPRIEDVLHCLERGSVSWGLLPHQNTTASKDAGGVPSPSRAASSRSTKELDRGDLAETPEERNPPPVGARQPPSVNLLNGVVTREGEIPFAEGRSFQVWIGHWENRGGGKGSGKGISKEGAGTKKVALKAFKPSQGRFGKAGRAEATERAEQRHKELESELLLWAEFHHANVLPFYGIVTDIEARLHMVFPWRDNGHLLDYVKKHPQSDKNYLLRGSAAGLSYLHQKKYVHGNVRCTNVFVSRKGEPQICDFGMTKLFHRWRDPLHDLRYDRLYTLHLSLRHAAPELIKHSDFLPTMSSDTYSFALLILECITEAPPFSNLEREAEIIHERINKGKSPPRPDGKHHIPDDLWDLMERCWSLMPERRPPMAEVHRFFCGIDQGTGKV